MPLDLRKGINNLKKEAQRIYQRRVVPGEGFQMEEDQLDLSV